MQDNDTHCFLLLRTMLYRFFRGRTLAGTDSHVFLPMITALRLLWSRVSVVFLAKNFRSCLCRCVGGGEGGEGGEGGGAEGRNQR